MGRRLGQHFLNNSSILNRIALYACPEPEPLVVEIGPGKGALTSALLEKSERVIAVELDPELSRALEGSHSRLTVIHSDVLETDLAQWGPVVIAGNLPYYITSPIVEKTIALGRTLKRAVFLMQKEVAQRIAANPGGRDYGYLSVITQIACNVEYLFTVPPGAFAPPPKVDSAVVRFTPRESPVDDPKSFRRFVSACFRQKRKNLRNNLAGLFGKAEMAGLPEGNLRAEQLSIDDLVRLYKSLGV